MKVRLLAKAETELLVAVTHYNDELPGLGYEFMDEFLQTVDRVLLHPHAWQKLSSRSR